MSAFDHTLTGHRLVGRHAGLACRDCHRAEHILEADRLTAVGKDLDRTFLGLGTECLACHRDEHRGQLAEDCTSCHTQDSWLPAAGFDHATTRFPLTGLHRPLGCEACHERVEDPVGDDADYLRFAGVAFQSCSACHADPHSSRFGNRCESCHSTAGWNRVDDARMDHDLTRYPLVGRHREVACESCHRPGAPKRGLRFAACTDCHADEHGGQLASRADGGRCESCHTVEGFTPALYTRDDHDDVFRLVGAHRELECGACHVPVEPAVVAAAPPPDGGELLRFRFASTECQDCHDDPHTGTTDTIAGTIGCLLCHGQVLWEETSFDHGLTGFELLGPHAELACAQCHVRAPGETGEVLEFAGLGVGCESCHESPHGGQFAAADGSVDCLRCHALEAWRPAAGFDHQRDAEFALEGAHARVACESCHRPELVDGVEVVRYKPLPRRCIDCHGG